MTDGKEKNKELDKEKFKLVEKIIVTIVGVVFILFLIFVLGAEPCSASVFGVNFKLPTCEEGDAQSTSPIEGVWVVNAGQGNSEVDIIITIVDDCEAGNVCGTINLPTIPCQASIYVRNIDGLHYDYDAVDHQGSCGVPGVEYLELKSNGLLEYSYNGLNRTLRRK